jgi:ribose transport system permease protein
MVNTKVATVSSPEATKTQPRDPERVRLMRSSPSHLLGSYGLCVAFLAVVIVFSALRPDTFATAANFQTIASAQATLVILCVGLILPLTAGELDLSVAGMMGVSVMLVGELNVNHGWPISLAVLAALAAGILVGATNAFFTLKVGIDSIVVTLGTGTILTGAALGISGSAIGGISPDLVNASRTEIFGIQSIFYFGVAVTLMAAYIYACTPLGQRLFFTGAGRDVARLTGVRVDRVRAGTLVAAGALAALAGVLLTGLQGTADPNVGTSYLLPTFAGAYLGATAITPGRFNPIGSFIAIYFLATGITGLELLGLSGWIEQVFYGTSLVAAVTLSTLAARRRAGRA